MASGKMATSCMSVPLSLLGAEARALVVTDPSSCSYSVEDPSFSELSRPSCRTIELPKSLWRSPPT